MAAINPKVPVAMVKEIVKKIRLTNESIWSWGAVVVAIMPKRNPVPLSLNTPGRYQPVYCFRCRDGRFDHRRSIAGAGKLEEAKIICKSYRFFLVFVCGFGILLRLFPYLILFNATKMKSNYPLDFVIIIFFLCLQPGAFI